MDVNHECFASPWNVTLGGYNSANPDLEKVFGSSGSFYEMFDPREGSFEANPPFCELPMVVSAPQVDCFRLYILLQCLCVGHGQTIRGSIVGLHSWTALFFCRHVGMG